MTAPLTAAQLAVLVYVRDGIFDPGRCFQPNVDALLADRLLATVRLATGDTYLTITPAGRDLLLAAERGSAPAVGLMVSCTCPVSAGNTSPNACLVHDRPVRRNGRQFVPRDRGTVELALAARPPSIREQHADATDDPSDWDL